MSFLRIFQESRPTLFDELIKTSSAASPVAAEAVRRIAWLYRIEAEVRTLSSEERWRVRQERSKPLWDELHVWLQLERARVPEGSAIAKAIDYSLNRWAGLGQFLLDGDVAVDNNSCEIERTTPATAATEQRNHRRASVDTFFQNEALLMASMLTHRPGRVQGATVSRLPRCNQRRRSRS